MPAGGSIRLSVERQLPINIDPTATLVVTARDVESRCALHYILACANPMSGLTTSQFASASAASVLLNFTRAGQIVSVTAVIPIRHASRRIKNSAICSDLGGILMTLYRVHRFHESEQPAWPRQCTYHYRLHGGRVCWVQVSVLTSPLSHDLRQSWRVCPHD
jgi:hypothetical protein